MNRTLTNVLFGGIGTTAVQSDYKIEGQITKTSVDETAEALNNADSVILVRLTHILLTNVNISLLPLGGRIRYGGSQGTVRHRRGREHASCKGHYSSLRYPSCCWTYARPMQRLARRGLCSLR